ncbi:hypothetical protein KTE91_18210 [Burkholderia multivorans]|nr:hypothetical protein [Burkholderia multivorans]MBU9437035.1 hypothetical protein [Burkholderia multivorans]
MKDRLIRWLETEPVWWHFWDPRTGPAGGMVAALLAGAVAIVIALVRS